MHPFPNAERLQSALGWPMVVGYSVYEREDRPEGAAFVAIRWWWNEMPNGSWVSLTPLRDEPMPLLLVECLRGGEKPPAALDDAGHRFAIRLGRALRGAASVPAPKPFIPATSFGGAREGYAFRTGASGTGYYLDDAAITRDGGSMVRAHSLVPCVSSVATGLHHTKMEIGDVCSAEQAMLAAKAELERAAASALVKCKRRTKPARR